MSTKVQLAGGNFQDPEGNTLANGYLIMVLSQDAQANMNTQVAGGRKIKILLDGAGNIITTPGQFVWGNDVLFPTGTYYTVTGYTQAGQAAWGPNQVIVTSTGIGGEFDAGQWVPLATNVISGPAPSVTIQQILLETNYVPNASQNTLNLIAGSNVTLTDVIGGGVQISATGGGGGGGGNVGPNFVTYSATPIFDLSLGSTQGIVLTGNVTSSTAINAVNGQVYTFIVIQDTTGGRAFTWPSNFVSTGPIDSFDGTAHASTTATQSFVYINTQNRFIAVTSLIANQ